MKSKSFFIGLLAIVLLNFGCSGTKDSTEIEISLTFNTDESQGDFKMSFVNGQGYNYPTFVIWSENMDGQLIKTHFITKSYASGIFGYQMEGDSIWKPIPGPSYQPAALPYWTYKKGLINNKSLIPTPDNPYIDAFTGATPEQNFEVVLPNDTSKQFRLLVEVNQAWDWNNFWNNNKYPENKAYKNSAQPSIIYAVTINNEMDTFFLNPIGHGDPTGESGHLFTNISTLTTAKEIFKSIKIERLDQ